LLLAAETLDGPPFSKDALEMRSCAASGMGDVARGEIADSLELPSDKVLAEGETTSDGLLCWDGGRGGASDFPLPNILPPPSLRPDITGVV
jgi:hypothetical protein